MELKELLIKGAIGAYGCAEGLAQLDGAQDKDDMLQCFLDRIDFCLARNFPDKNFLKEHFGEKLLEHKGIYIDRKVKLFNTGAVLLGDCNGWLMVNEYAVCRLYAKHNTSLDITAEDYAFVMIDVLDDAFVNIDCSEKARVVVNLYARAGALAQGCGRVKIIHKYKETYDL